MLHISVGKSDIYYWAIKIKTVKIKTNVRFTWITQFFSYAVSDVSNIFLQVLLKTYQEYQFSFPLEHCKFFFTIIIFCLSHNNIDRLPKKGIDMAAIIIVVTWISFFIEEVQNKGKKWIFRVDGSMMKFATCVRFLLRPLFYSFFAQQEKKIFIREEERGRRRKNIIMSLWVYP